MREKISFEIKQKAATEIESGRLSQSEAARRLGINKKRVALMQPVLRMSATRCTESLYFCTRNLRVILRRLHDANFVENHL